MIDWNQIDTVLLDMDGTLLDLHFDNHFWLDYVPRRYAETRGLEPEVAKADLLQRYKDRVSFWNYYQRKHNVGK